MERPKQLNLQVVSDPRKRTLVRHVAALETAPFQMRNHAIDGLGLDAGIDVARRREGNVMTVKCNLHRERADDYDIVANRLENCRSIKQ